MSRRDLSQPSFVDAMVGGYGKVGGFLDRIEQGFDWSAFEALLSRLGDGRAPGLSAFDDVQDRSSSEKAERQPVAHRLLRGGIEERVPLLQKQDLEHRQRRIARRAPIAEP